MDRIAMVGEEVLGLPREISALPKGAGEKHALKAKGYFEPSPHRGLAHAILTYSYIGIAVLFLVMEVLHASS